MNQIPSIDQFLEEIDSDKTIDREKAMAEISAVALKGSIDDAKTNLDSDSQKSLEQILQNKDKFDYEAIIDLFEKGGKKAQFLNSINDNINKVRVDYIKTHLGAMQEDQREKVFSKFPTLREL